MSLATATIVGRVGKDPETRATPSGKNVTSFSVAVNEGYGDNIKTMWFNVQAWEPLADRIPKFVKKGALVAVAGRLKVEEWTKEGQKQSRTVIVANDVQRLDSRDSADASGGKASAPTSAPKAAPPKAAPKASPKKEVNEDPFDDLGFGGDEEMPF
jgi:single-strand DNA-binding protein